MTATIVAQPTPRSIALAKGQNPNPPPATITHVHVDATGALTATCHTVGQAFTNAIRGIDRLMLTAPPMPRALLTEGTRATSSRKVRTLTEEQRARKNAADRARRAARKAATATIVVDGVCG